MAEEQEKTQKPKATLIKHRKPDSPASSESKTDKKKVVVVKKKTTKKPVPKVVVQKQDDSHERNRADEEQSGTVSPPASPVQAAVEKETETPRTHKAVSARDSDDTGGGTESHDSGERQPTRPASRAGGDSPRESGLNSYKAQPRSGSDGRPAYGTGPRRSSSPAYKQGYKNPNPPPKPERPAPGAGYRDNQGGGGNFRSAPGGRPGGFTPRPGGGTGGPGGFRSGGPGGPKPGGFRGGAPRPGGGGTSPMPPEGEAKTPGKKFFKAKKPSYQKKKEPLTKERDFQIKKKAVQMANPVPKEIDIMDVITVADLAKKMNLKASELISKLMGMGMMVTINQQIDADTAEILAAEYKCKVNIVSLYDETLIESDAAESEEALRPRPPIVTVMGHVDHGKTKLLDAIREANVVAGEFGGITQHIGAYKVALESGDIVFLDTPGHEAFTLMRARGAQITDLVILVVAANDGVMPQTIEAIDHAKEAGVPIIVAVNKCDLPEANPDRVKQQLSDRDLVPEEWGGSTIFVEISALKKEGIKELLEAVLLQAEMLELKADYSCRAEGKVIESKVDHGRGIVGTVIIERGTLRIGDPFVAGTHAGKVRAMFDDKGNKIDEAPPATPVEILGLTGVPNSGSPFQVTESERVARQVGTKRQELEKHGEAKNVKKITLDNLYDSIQDGEIQELKVIIKGDVHGSVEALQTALEKLSTSEIKLTAIRASAGAIIENDVNLASASNAIIIGFHVRPTPKALVLAEQEKVDIRKYNVIYDCVEDIRSAMEGLLAPELKEAVVGTVEVRDVFKVPKIGLIAGCYVTSGKITRNANVHVYRDGVEIYTGKVTSLKRFKDDAKMVEKGYECGVGIENYVDVQEGDLFEVFEIHEVAKKLENNK